MSKKAIISGVSGQDGAYLARLLLSKGYTVIGTSRDAEANSFLNLEKLGIQSQVLLISMNLCDFYNVLQVITKHEPDEIYNLGGLTSVALSFTQPIEAMQSISGGIQNILEAVRITNKKIRVYNAGSSESYGDTGKDPAKEGDALSPRSPYAIAKAAAIWQVANYREAYNLFACTGLLFNHESPLRQQNFITSKIINNVKQIRYGNISSISVGNLDIIRDWGWAPEYVEAMWMMMQMPSPDDYVIATGVSHSLKNFIKKVFEINGLDWEKYVKVDNNLYRPLDITISRANPEKARKKLGWQAKVNFDQVIESMVAKIMENS
jgi:GDPmannose 4,6-dehydratase